MKCVTLLLLLGLLNNAIAQEVDSIAIRNVDSLIQVSRALTAKREFDQALGINAAAEKLALEKFGPESASYGSCAFNRGRVYHFKADYTEAEWWYLEAKDIRQKVLGKEHLDYAWSLNNLALLYADMDLYEKAEPFYLESRDIREKALGAEHPDYTSSLNNLAALYWKMGNYEKAELLYLDAKNIREKVLGVDHPDYAASLNNIALLYWKLGNYEKAEPLYLEAKNILEKVLGKEHPDYAASLYNLALLYKDKGEYEKAEPFYLEAKDIRKKVLGKEHPNYASNLANLAIVYAYMGNYEKAELFYLESMAIWKEVLGREHPEYAASLNNLASLYANMGSYEKAEPLYLEAKNIWEKAPGVEHPVYAKSLNNLAGLYTLMGNYEKAKPLHLESLSIKEKVLGRDHPDYASGLNNLAALYAHMGNYEKAEPCYLESKDIRQKVLGKEHPGYAQSLTNLADLYVNMGNYEKAELLNIEANAIWEKTLGKEHPGYSQSLTNLADLYETQSLYTRCTPLLAEALAIGQTRIAGGISFLSERELSQYAVTQQRGMMVNSYLLHRPVEQADILPGLSYDQSLFRKGFLMQNAARLQHLTSSSSHATAINNVLKGFRRRIAKQLSLPIAERRGVEELEEKANALEKEFSRTVAGYAEALRQVKWQDVQAVLPATAMALEFVHFQVNFPHSTDSTMYAALLLRPGTDPPDFIPLFEEKEIDHLLRADRERKADYVNELYAWGERGMIKLGGAKKSLHDLIWAKIQAQIPEGIKTIFYSPSGVLHRLNLGAVAVDDETILSDKYNLVALNSTRQLVLPSEINSPSNDAILVGGVNFEVESTMPKPDDEPLLASRSAADAWTESGTRGGIWSYLKWTEKEVERISTTLAQAGFETQTISGLDATEESVKAIGSTAASPRILHIATHGFFFPDLEKQTSATPEGEPVFKWSYNPMIRSGLILAGGNYAWQHGRAVGPEKEDGILTAYEISQMNLSNTELVVLSACETGLGDIQGNEGVYGLQRAFKIAGAKYLIMSLWQVPDRETMEFMTTFYKNWLTSKMTIPDAFRQTQREMRDRFINPYAWGAFVLLE